MKDKPTPVEKHDDGKGKIGEQVIHFGEGLLDSIVDLVKGLADSTVGIIKYDASFFTYLYGELSGMKYQNGQMNTVIIHLQKLMKR